MTTIILVILGVVLAAAAALFIVYYGGDAFGNGRIEAEAGRLVSESSQVEAALELYYRQEGHYPRGDDPVEELIAAGYLTHAPLGTRTTLPDRWKIDYDAEMIRALLGTTDDDEAVNICLTARQQLDLPEANTASGVYRCDGSDSPNGRLAGREPCCIGEVSPGGGPVEGGNGGEPENVYARACGNLGAMPVGTPEQKSAYMETALVCLSGKIIDTPIDGSTHNQDSLPLIGGESIDWSSVASGLDWQYVSNGRVYAKMRFPRSEVSTYCQGKQSFNNWNWQSSYPLESTEPFCFLDGANTNTFMVIPVDVYQSRLTALRSRFEGVIQRTGVNGTKTTYLGAGNPDPDFSGLLSSWYFTETTDGSLWLTSHLKNGSMTFFCDWFEEKFNTTRTADEICNNFSGDSYYELDSGDTIRNRQLALLRSEMAKIATSAISRSRYDRSRYDAANGYTPDFQSLVTSWDIRSDTNGEMRVSSRVQINNMRNFCAWYQRKFGETTSTDRCVDYSSDGYFETYVTEPFRQAQHNKLRTEFEKVKNDIVRLNVTSKSAYDAQGGYVPDIAGVDMGGPWKISNRNGQYYIELRNSGSYMTYFCDWFEGKFGASTSVDECLNYNRDGYYLYKLPGMSGGVWQG